MGSGGSSLLFSSDKPFSAVQSLATVPQVFGDHLHQQMKQFRDSSEHKGLRPNCSSVSFLFL
uniref:Uncharacterized protein n=1 Tax=uncultured gamma proteobacterium HF0010_16J05 TaxID=710981 RepID=E0XR41_9GAMM|nr:hypothetical protein [uncultured gamma proteobacterium HF0010_16J05]